MFGVIKKLAAAVVWSALGATLAAAGDVPSPQKLVVCADPYNFPASMKDTDPPGYDVEIVRAIARQLGSQIEYFWSDTGTRGGLGRALRSSISQKKCSLFVGLGVSPESADELKEKHLVFTRPYMSEAFVLVDRGSDHGNIQGRPALADFKNVKIGVSMSSPADAFLFDHGYDRSVFARERQVLKALDAGEVDIALVWSPALAYARKDYSNARFHVISKYEPEAALRWNMAMAVPESDAKLKQSLDDAIGALLNSGEIKRIVESYGVPFFAPIS